MSIPYGSCRNTKGWDAKAAEEWLNRRLDRQINEARYMVLTIPVIAAAALILGVCWVLAR
jgi:hypothetical protein